MGLGLITCGESSEASTPSLQELCRFTTGHHVVEEEEKSQKVEQEVEREDQVEETAHMWMTMDGGGKSQTT